MDKIEFERRKKELWRMYEEKLYNLACECASENNPVEIGDIVTDHFHTIKVECMRAVSDTFPYMKYFGTELTKKGEPKKRQEQTPVHQINIQFINGKPYKFKEG